MYIYLKTPENNSVKSHLSHLQSKFINDGANRDRKVADVDWLNPQAGGEDYSKPEPVIFSWELSEDVSDSLNVELFISTDIDFVNAKRHECKKKSIEIYNLLSGVTYYWKVCTSDGRYSSDVFNFKTAPSWPRFIKIDNLTNVRDIGGDINKQGHRIRQGLVYRGSEMNVHHFITDSGRDTMLNQLKIKTELDLRSSALGNFTESELGSGVDYKLIPVEAYEEFIPEKETCRRIFKLFTDYNNYPFYIHCWAGADRAGTLVFLLSAMLGMDKEHLFCDYELTSLSIYRGRSRNADMFQLLLKALDDYGDDNSSINDKCINYLLSAGITMDDIKEIMNIMIEY